MASISLTRLCMPVCRCSSSDCWTLSRPIGQESSRQRYSFELTPARLGQTGVAPCEAEATVGVRLAGLCSRLCETPSCRQTRRFSSQYAGSPNMWEAWCSSERRQMHSCHRLATVVHVSATRNDIFEDGSWVVSEGNAKSTLDLPSDRYSLGKGNCGSTWGSADEVVVGMELEGSSLTSGEGRQQAGREGMKCEEQIEESVASAGRGDGGDSGTFGGLSSSQLHTASLTQALTSQISRRLTSSAGSVNRLTPRMARINFLAGPFGILMALAVAVAGLATALRSHMQHLEEIWSEDCCLQCNNEGLERCDVCQGVGEIQWEGKLYHRDPCPACMGKKLRKCSNCNGACQGKKKRSAAASVKGAMGSRRN